MEARFRIPIGSEDSATQLDQHGRSEREEQDDWCLARIVSSMCSFQPDPSIHAEQELLYGVPGLWARAAVFLGGDAFAETRGM
jgi:hypothetical protein